MGTYTRTLHRFTLGTDEETTTVVETYKQPTFDRLRYKAFYTLWKLTLIKPIHKAIDGPLEKVHQKVHALNCDNNCTMGEKKNKNTGDWEPVIMCGSVPLCAKLDIKLYDLDGRNNTDVTQK